MVGQFISIVFEQSLDSVNFVGCSFIFKTEKNNASMLAPLSINFFSKAFVICYQNPILCERFLDDIFIIHTTCFFVHREDFMILLA